jgi:hypothetical protein
VHGKIFIGPSENLRACSESANSKTVGFQKTKTKTKNRNSFIGGSAHSSWTPAGASSTPHLQGVYIFNKCPAVRRRYRRADLQRYARQSWHWANILQAAGADFRDLIFP